MDIIIFLILLAALPVLCAAMLMALLVAIAFVGAMMETIGIERSLERFGRLCRRIDERCKLITDLERGLESAARFVQGKGN